jgi:GLPGLI family protein
MKVNNAMKNILLLLGILVMLTAAHFVFGQVSEGVIEYEVKVNMHRRLSPEQASMKEMIPEFNTSKDQLFFNEKESLYKSLEEENDEPEENGGGMRIHLRRPNIQIYFDYSLSRKVMRQEFMGKQYLIEDSIKIAPWKLSTETKTILGYTCRQGSYVNNERKATIIAWYTDQLKPFLGPEGFNSLPGTILQVDINNGERTITAQKIESRSLKKGEMKIPSGGQRMTSEEFNKMQDVQMERMRANGANVIIRH